MRIEHIAIWVRDLEKMKAFYVQYFNTKVNDLYYNPKKNFSSYFLSFEDGARLEIMQRPDIPESKNDVAQQNLGFSHFAISVGSIEKVNILTEELRKDGYTIYSEPRTTGDGYYESAVLDPENNLIEITI